MEIFSHFIAVFGMIAAVAHERTGPVVQKSAGKFGDLRLYLYPGQHSACIESRFKNYSWCRTAGSAIVQFVSANICKGLVSFILTVRMQAADLLISQAGYHYDEE